MDDQPPRNSQSDSHILDAVVLFLLGAVLVLVGLLVGLLATELNLSRTGQAPSPKPISTVGPEPRGTVMGIVRKNNQPVNGTVEFVPAAAASTTTNVINGNYAQLLDTTTYVATAFVGGVQCGASTSVTVVAGGVERRDFTCP